MGFFRRLTSVMFYAALPLFIPLLYGLYLGEDVLAIAVTVLILILPFIPGLIAGIYQNLRDFVISIFRPEIPWNYLSLTEIAGIRARIGELTLGEALALTSCAWIVIPLICSYPFLYLGMEPLDSFFESMSGWTSTGLSVIDLPEDLPQSIILYRSTMQWVGGLGIIVLMLAVLKGREARWLLKAEGREPIEVGIGRTVKKYWLIYLVLSIIAFGVLSYLGLDIFNALNLTFAGISNGGFFPFSHYDFTELQKYALAGIMLAGATSFVFWRNIAGGRILKAIKDEEFIFYVVVILVSIGLIVYVGGEDISNTFLNAVSAVACGGFAIGDVAVMHEFSKYMLILLMLAGGMYGSTTGAIKLWRILVAFKSILLRVKSVFLPTGTVQVLKINNMPVPGEAVIDCVVYIFSYVVIMLFGAGLFIAVGHSMTDALFTVSSALGNVGLSTVAASSLGTNGKSFLILLMYVGRIEIFPTLALARYVIDFIRR
jgi:trk system potassium uptake protein TrkH